MGKILGLDVGDVWTGTALSDETKIIASPYKTIKTSELEQFISSLLKKESLEKIVVGLPKTMRGTESQQTNKTISLKEKFEKKFPDITWILWDERLTSKHAAKVKKTKKKEDKIASHSIAAAFILTSYLEHMIF